MDEFQRKSDKFYKVKPNVVIFFERENILIFAKL